ncbi:hypothetical protein [Acinetobacter sp. YH1901134]|uniref:hypothetical protein n=1 Tax=Acinetobacter sp. YH1901134 TaxID=2601199 RepID=UPI0015D16142|nr:hypothetical protein [Acinetobacter sp. YH1901134]
MQSLLGYFIFFLVTLFAFKAYAGMKADILFYFVGFLYLVISFLIYYPIRRVYISNILPKRLHKHKLSYLKADGFNDNYSATGVVIDTVQRKIAFTAQTITGIIIFDLSDIRSWSIETQTNTIQRSDGREISRNHYSIVVNTNNAEQPMFKFFVANFHDAQSWIARFNAIING